MAGLTSEVQADGTTQITQTDRPSNYDLQIEKLDGSLPDAPSEEALKKLFSPKYVLTVTIDGTEIPFIYKRMDPATLIITHDQPVSIDPGVNKQLANNEEPVNLNQITVHELLHDPSKRQALKDSMHLVKITVQGAVVSPKITDEIYENLDNQLIDALYAAITGEVKDQQDLVHFFREKTENA